MNVQIKGYMRRYILAMGLEKVEQSRLKSRVCNKSDIKKKINLD